MLIKCHKKHDVKIEFLHGDHVPHGREQACGRQGQHGARGQARGKEQARGTREQGRGGRERAHGKLGVMSMFSQLKFVNIYLILPSKNGQIVQFPKLIK